MKRHGREKHVVDTNVIVIANKKNDVSYSCTNNCVQALLNIKRFGVVVVDESGLILEEYRTNCSRFGQPGVGNAFVRWIYDNLGRTDLVEKIALTPRTEPPRDYEEFPEHPDLADFDPSDQKFVAVANKHPAKPVILQALDSKWWGWKDGLANSGITVRFLCPDEIQATYRRKMKR
ncbi:MAG TPA: PIN domain-containing protein [Candidatus Angelobacter sp.]|nr:PIN domain-containing protein [Candidatus Angelobacter sp.]